MIAEPCDSEDAVTAARPPCASAIGLGAVTHTHVGGSVTYILQLVATRPFESLLRDHADCLINVGV